MTVNGDATFAIQMAAENSCPGSGRKRTPSCARCVPVFVVGVPVTAMDCVPTPASASTFHPMSFGNSKCAASSATVNRCGAK